jgi:hypothetical protein
MSDLTLTAAIGENAPMTLTGRDAWALRELIRAGNRGCTPIDNPAPRWSAYVHKLRHKFGVDIRTIHEGHGGQFPGNHARYILRSRVRVLEHEGPLA